MDYTQMTIFELEELIVAECLEQGITTPREQMQYIEKANKPLADTFIDKNKHIG